MGEIKKIYNIYGGKLVSVNVEKVTKKLVWIEGVREFAYIKTHNKEHVCVTPQEAVQEELNRCLEHVGIYSDRLKRAEERLLKARSLCAEYGVQQSNS